MPRPSRLRLALGACGLLAAVALIGWIDYITGAEIGLSLLYLLPLVLAGWRLGGPAATALAVAAAGAWFVADAAWFPAAHLPISAWNGFTRLVIFVAFALGAARLRRDREELLDLNRRLRELLGREQELARTDGLTGLANARAFGERLASELPRMQRNGQALCLVYLDVDNFKQINDRFGHAVGDDLLRKTAALIRQSVRAGDLPARMGGDEFAIALWDVEQAAAEAVARRLTQGLAALDADYPEVEVGASVGIAWLHELPDSADEALRIADAAMYAAKGAGKGRIALANGARQPPELLGAGNAVEQRRPW